MHDMIRLIISITLCLLIITAAVVVLGGFVPRGNELAPQPIEFNHKIHLDRVQGIQCQNCHLFAVSEHFAGIPGKELCFGCHDPVAEEGDADADANKTEFAALMSFTEAGGDIPWRRVTALREDVFFSHRRHFGVAKIGCRHCHADIPDRTRPPTEGPIEMSMGTCIDCHESSAASVDCIACHR